MTDANGTVLAPRRLALAEWDEEFARLVKTTILRPKERDATSAELALFAEQVQRTGLNPFLGQIYGIFRKSGGVERMINQVGIDGFRLIAERTGKYEGQTQAEWCSRDGVWKDVWLSEDPPAAARIGVLKTGRREATYAIAHWNEYVQTNRDGRPTDMWRNMPANQLAKCAEALALRKAFPAELSGLHTPEEMAQADSIPPEVVAAMPATDDRPTDQVALEIAELAKVIVDEGIWSEADLRARLVGVGVFDTSLSVQEAIKTTTAALADDLHNVMADLLAAAEEEASS